MALRLDIFGFTQNEKKYLVKIHSDSSF